MARGVDANGQPPPGLALTWVWRITLRASALRWAWRGMPDYRRWRVAEGAYFFTVNLLERRLDTLVRHVDALREAVRVTRRERPFHIDAWVGLA